jgi:hypothetical protein
VIEARKQRIVAMQALARNGFYDPASTQVEIDLQYTNAAALKIACMD